MLKENITFLFEQLTNLISSETNTFKSAAGMVMREYLHYLNQKIESPDNNHIKPGYFKHSLVTFFHLNESIKTIYEDLMGDQSQHIALLSEQDEAEEFIIKLTEIFESSKRTHSLIPIQMNTGYMDYSHKRSSEETEAYLVSTFETKQIEKFYESSSPITRPMRGSNYAEELFSNNPEKINNALLHIFSEPNSSLLFMFQTQIFDQIYEHILHPSNQNSFLTQMLREVWISSIIQLICTQKFDLNISQSLCNLVAYLAIFMTPEDLRKYFYQTMEAWRNCEKASEALPYEWVLSSLIFSPSAFEKIIQDERIIAYAIEHLEETPHQKLFLFLLDSAFGVDCHTQLISQQAKKIFTIFKSIIEENLFERTENEIEGIFRILLFLLKMDSNNLEHYLNSQLSDPIQSSIHIPNAPIYYIIEIIAETIIFEEVIEGISESTLESLRALAIGTLPIKKLLTIIDTIDRYKLWEANMLMTQSKPQLALEIYEELINIEEENHYQLPEIKVNALIGRAKIYQSMFLSKPHQNSSNISLNFLAAPKSPRSPQVSDYYKRALNDYETAHELDPKNSAILSEIEVLRKLIHDHQDEKMVKSPR